MMVEEWQCSADSHSTFNEQVVFSDNSAGDMVEEWQCHDDSIVVLSMNKL